MLSGCVSLNKGAKNLYVDTINSGDVLQLDIRPNYFLYKKSIFFFFKGKILLNKKLKKLFFFKILKKKNTLKKKVFLKKKINNFFNFFNFFKLNLSKSIEIDYITLTAFFLSSPNILELGGLYNFKTINTAMFRLINFKKLN